MTPNHAEVLSAFFDGEPVEAETLAASLQEPDAIEYLVEFARLRRAVHEDTSRPTEEFCEAMREQLSRDDRQHRVRRRLLQLSLAASLALAAALGGFTARGMLERPQPAAGGGQATREGRARQSQPTPAPQPISLPVVKTPDSVGVPSKPSIPSPRLRIERFDEWRSDRVL
jgi:hypothetical protein